MTRALKANLNQENPVQIYALSLALLNLAPKVLRASTFSNLAPKL